MENWRGRCTSTRRAAVGDAVAEHADARNGGRLSGTVLFEGTNVSEGRGTTQTVRADWRAMDRCGALAEKLAAYGCRRALPAGRVRADVSETRQTGMRRLPDSRARSRRVRAVETAVAVLSEIRAQKREVRMAPAAVRIRARKAAFRHPLRLERTAAADRGRASLPTIPPVGEGTRAFARRASRSCCTEALNTGSTS